VSQQPSTRIALRCDCGDTLSSAVTPERPAERTIAAFKKQHQGDKHRVRGRFYPPRRQRHTTTALGSIPRRRTGPRDL
jgi:hypothetical protein